MARQFRSFSFRESLVFGLLLALLGCTGGEQHLPSSQFKITSYELPKALQNDRTLSVGGLDKVGTLIGSGEGLYTLTGTGLQNLEKTTVVGIAPWQDRYLAIASPKRLQVWDGTLHPSDIAQALQDADITEIAAQNKDTLWIATTGPLFCLKGETLYKYPDFSAVKALYSFRGSPVAVIQTSQGEYRALQIKDDGTLAIEEFQGQNAAPAIVLPDKHGQIWGLLEGFLYRWISKGEANAWESFSWTPKASDGSRQVVTQLALDAMDGSVWAISDQTLALLSSQTVFTIARPAAISTVVVRRAFAGSLWIADPQKLHHISFYTEGSAITYEGRIKAFLEQNCLRCHGSLGPGRRLDSYDDARTNAQAMLQAIEEGRMPPDQKPLIGGDAQMLRLWLQADFPK